jgi:hypothetical protein
VHCFEHVCFCREHCSIRWIIISEDNGIFVSETISLINELRNVDDIVDTSMKLILCPNVIDSNEKRLVVSTCFESKVICTYLSASSALRVLKLVLVS